ncbi:DUF1501 domain-containing protein [Photobacterium lutimaris]|uniref:Tat pathway signal protein n=1 Tax=Photobacterium lutimaris TaxID=388278 RepID=A0A2T3J199_9GAMM|nr:DUF1501 domain-containing protein [Photobacterium lutimaris]PSU34862.1 hypothetical protein C9I99_07200 [Photobacterium lutimaris]TDR77205.1 uncharacterized protein (DUF1501 family) [Photobacterium lutimaris]
MKLSRRHFLKSTAALGATSVAPAVTGLNMAHAAPDDYKALVCIFLFGGNDAYNMVIPDDVGNYQKYQAARPGLAIDQNSLVPLGIETDNNVPLGLHPAMASLGPAFADGNATVLVNTGQLVEPVIGSPNPNCQLPDFLMAHNLQQTMWQSGAKNMGDPLGWAGRMVEHMQLSGTLSPLMSLNGEQKWLRNNHVEPLVMTSDGAGDYNGMNTSNRVDAMLRHFNEQYANLFTDNYSTTMASRYYENDNLASVLDTEEDLDGFPTTALGKMLHTTAKLIKVRNSNALQHRRQIFFLGLGGFDTHKDQADTHSALLGQVADAMAAFYQEMQGQGLSNNVTTFTMSDFGRRIMANDSGTDHGWAGHQLVMGGAVKGGKAYGKWPDLSPESEYNYKNGRLIPEIAADQVNATLAQWFGFDGESKALFPSLEKFKHSTIPFL